MFGVIGFSSMVNTSTAWGVGSELVIVKMSTGVLSVGVGLFVSSEMCLDILNLKGSSAMLEQAMSEEKDYYHNTLRYIENLTDSDIVLVNSFIQNNYSGVEKYNSKYSGLYSRLKGSSGVLNSTPVLNSEFRIGYCNYTPKTGELLSDAVGMNRLGTSILESSWKKRPIYWVEGGLLLFTMTTRPSSGL